MLNTVYDAAAVRVGMEGPGPICNQHELRIVNNSRIAGCIHFDPLTAINYSIESVRLESLRSVHALPQAGKVKRACLGRLPGTAPCICSVSLGYILACDVSRRIDRHVSNLQRNLYAVVVAQVRI